MDLSDSGLVVHAATCFFAGCAVTRLAFIGPHVRKPAVAPRADAASIASWLILALVHAGTSLYAFAIRHDSTSGLTAAANLLACVVIAGLAWRRRSSGESTGYEAIVGAVASHSWRRLPGLRREGERFYSALAIAGTRRRGAAAGMRPSSIP